MTRKKDLTKLGLSSSSLNIYNLKCFWKIRFRFVPVENVEKKIGTSLTFIRTECPKRNFVFYFLKPKCSFKLIFYNNFWLCGLSFFFGKWE